MYREAGDIEGLWGVRAEQHGHAGVVEGLDERLAHGEELGPGCGSDRLRGALQAFDVAVTQVPRQVTELGALGHRPPGMGPGGVLRQRLGGHDGAAQFLGALRRGDDSCPIDERRESQAERERAALGNLCVLRHQDLEVPVQVVDGRLAGREARP